MLQVGGSSVIVATLFGRVERNLSRIGVAVARGSAPRAIVPQVGHVVVCRSLSCCAERTLCIASHRSLQDYPSCASQSYSRNS